MIATIRGSHVVVVNMESCDIIRSAPGGGPFAVPQGVTVTRYARGGPGDSLAVYSALQGANEGLAVEQWQAMEDRRAGSFGPFRQAGHRAYIRRSGGVATGPGRGFGPGRRR